jgi:hypothetical protein
MNRHVERWYPFVIAVAVTAIYFYSFSHAALPETVKNILGSAINISAISIGFLMTSKSILFSIHDRKIIQLMRDAKLYDYLIGYIMTAVHCSFLFLIVSTIGLLICSYDYWYRITIGIWLFLGTGTLLCFYRVIRIFSKILRLDS